MRTSGAEQRLSLCEVFTMDISDADLTLPGETPDSMLKHFNRIAKQGSVVTADKDVSVPDIFQICADQFFLKIFIDSGVFKPIIQIEHPKYNIVFILDRGIAVFKLRIEVEFEMVPHDCHICPKQSCIFK